MGDLCKKHSFGYEPLKLLFGKTCALCLREQIKQLQTENAELAEAICIENQQLQAENKELKQADKDHLSARQGLEERFRQLQAELEKHRWIPVSERLPHVEPLIIVETTEFSTYYLLKYDQKEREYRDSMSGLWSYSYIKSITIKWRPIILPGKL